MVVDEGTERWLRQNQHPSYRTPERGTHVRPVVYLADGDNRSKFAAATAVIPAAARLARFLGWQAKISLFCG